MNYSAVLVTSIPDRLDETVSTINQMPSCEVHQIQAEACRCIVVIEAPTVNEEADLFKQLSELDSVVDVSLVVHHFEDDADLRAITPEAIERMN